MSSPVISTVVFSPKAFDLSNGTYDEKRRLGQIVIAAFSNIYQNGVILQPESNDTPWNKGFKDFYFEERIRLKEIVKKFLRSKRFIKIIINKIKLNDCQQVSKLMKIEELDFCVLPRVSICNFPYCCLIGTPNLCIDEFFNKKSLKIFEPLFKKRSFDINQKFGNINDLGEFFLKRLFHFTKDVEIIDRYAGQNLIRGTYQGTHYCTLSWMYEVFKTTNTNQGNFIIHTTTGDISQTPSDIENNAHQWISQQNVDQNHKILIKIYSYRNRRTTFPHHRVIHTDQFSFLFDSGFAFITDYPGRLELKNQPNYVNFFDQWNETVNTLRNLTVDSIIST